MKRSILLAATLVVLSVNASGAYARGDEGAAAAAGFIGGLVTGLLLDAPAPRVYRPGPVVIERYYDAPPRRHWKHDHRPPRHGHYEDRRWHDQGRRGRWD